MADSNITKRALATSLKELMAEQLFDKMSILLTFAFSYFVFGERLSRKAGIGLCLMTVGTLTMTCFG